MGSPVSYRSAGGFASTAATSSRWPASSGAGWARPTWQSLELFDDLTVEDNLAAERQSVGGFLADLVHLARRRGHVAHALDVLGIAELGGRMPDELSAGQRKLVGAAVAGRPRMLLMDEPAAGLDTAESREFAGRLRAVRDTGSPARRPRHGPRARRL